MLVGAANRSQVLSLVQHLTNPDEFCIRETMHTAEDDPSPSPCFWGLPSVAANDPSFMLPPSYIYWRGLSWGPHALLTYWSLEQSGFAESEPRVAAAMAALSSQKSDMMMSMWRRNRHICENYSPYMHRGQVPRLAPSRDCQTRNALAGRFTIGGH